MKKYSINRNIDFHILSQEEIELVHEKSLELIEKIGMKISGENIQSIMKSKGIKFDENDVAKIPREFIL